jgi:hypothetical protein
VPPGAFHQPALRRLSTKKHCAAVHSTKHCTASIANEIFIEVLEDSSDGDEDNFFSLSVEIICTHY